MKRDYKKWADVQERLNNKRKEKFFNEREIWWCAIGANIGYEIDGKGRRFTRPVVILRKFSANSCLVVPLSTRTKPGLYYLPLGNVDSKPAQAALSQLRVIDRRRLTLKVGTLSKNEFQELKKAVAQVVH